MTVPTPVLQETCHKGQHNEVKDSRGGQHDEYCFFTWAKKNRTSRLTQQTASDIDQ